MRLYALLAHPPHKCKEANSCQLILPAEACGRKSDAYLFAGSQPLRLAPSERWIVTVSARVQPHVESAVFAGSATAHCPSSWGGAHSSPPWPPVADSPDSWLRRALGTSR